MSVLVLILVLLFLAGILWFVNVKIPSLNPTIRWIINAVIIIIAAIITLSAFGVWEQVKDVKIPKL